MKSAETTTTADDETSKAPHLGSEYMNAQSYLTQPTRAPKVTASDPTFHGSNDSDYGADAQQRTE